MTVDNTSNKDVAAKKPQNTSLNQQRRRKYIYNHHSLMSVIISISDHMQTTVNDPPLIYCLPLFLYTVGCTHIVPEVVGTMGMSSASVGMDQGIWN